MIITRAFRNCRVKMVSKRKVTEVMDVIEELREEFPYREFDFEEEIIEEI